MRKKVMKLVVTFHTTSDAMAMEKVCKERNVPGRLIPVPRAISAGCGLSWCADLTDREQLLDGMKEVGIAQEDVHECLVEEVITRVWKIWTEREQALTAEKSLRSTPVNFFI